MPKRHAILGLGLLALLALLAGCRCENFGASECASSDRCRAITLWAADPVRECRGDSKFMRCERTPAGEPQLSNTKLLRDEEGRYWLGDPDELPGATIEDAGEGTSWGFCTAAEDASVLSADAASDD